MTRPDGRNRQPQRNNPPDAYDLLADFGVHPESPMADVHRAGIQAQRLGALTPERSMAWRELRDAEKRLVLDLFRTQQDPSVFGVDLPAPPSRWELLDEIFVDRTEPLRRLPSPESFLEDTK